VTAVFLDHVWLGPLVWALLYVSDYTLTLTCARLHQAGARDKIVIDGSYEITPFYQRDIDALRRVSPRFIAVLIIGFAAMCAADAAWAASMPELFAFLLGTQLLVQFMVHVRHVRNYVLFRAMSTDAVHGRIGYARPLMLKMSAIEIWTFAAMFAMLFFFTGSLFVLGGAVSCALLGRKHWSLMTQTRASPRTAPAATAAPPAC
jgi:hypothetical protein